MELFDNLNLAMFSGKGGVGKTTNSCAFAARWAATAYRGYSFSKRRPFSLLPYQSLLHECSAWSSLGGIIISGSTYIFLFAMAENL